MSDFKVQLQAVAKELEELMARILPETASNKEALLAEAMRYAVFTPGKRLRPYLLVCAADLFTVGRESALYAASAIEFIHTYSLVHDDLPAMDNDDYRRGQLSCHKKFGEAEAILAGDALLTLAFEILASPLVHPDSLVRCELISSVARAAGASGMVGGQVLDIMASDHNLNINEIIRMQRMKTGELFAISCEAGAILGKASKNLRLALKGYAHDLGLAFQIMDDLSDSSQDLHMVSKNSDNHFVKPNIVQLIGEEQSKEQAKRLVTQAIDHLSVFDKKADILRDLAQFIINQ